MKNCFIIVNCNDFKSTKHLVDNISTYENIDEILIVDNNSKEEEKGALEKLKQDNVNILFNEENLGYSYGINEGSKYLINKYKKCNLIISNSDIVIMSNEDIKNMLSVLNDPKVGLVGPQILELGTINRGRKKVSPLIDLFKYTPIIKDLLPDKLYEYSNSHYNTETSEVDTISSCFFMISSDTMKKINYMDEQVFLYYEDDILCKKVHDLNLQVLIYNPVKIKHLYSKTVDKIIKNNDKFKLFKESQLYYHTTYNDATKFERLILKLSYKIGSILRNKN